MAKRRENSKTIPAEKIRLLFVAIAVIFTFVIYFPSLKNDLTNWDDQEYVTNNPHIKGLNAENISYHFKNFHMGNYHPLAMISLSMDYKEPLDPKHFHFTNLVLHLLNTVLLFLFVWLLTQKNIIAFVSSLLFALHPMHVESVAWASERKDVLYVFFFLGALCGYTFSLTKKKNMLQWHILAFILFILALLSKGQAVVLPLLFVLIDVFKGQKLSARLFLAKLHLLACALIFGIIAIKAQQSFNAIQDTEVYSFTDRVIFAAYGIEAYLGKLLAPLNLSCFYPFPVKAGAVYKKIFYSGLVVLPVLIFITWKFRSNKYLLFAFLFFFVSVSIVLQLIPVGGAIIADRYTYIPYTGFFILAGKFFSDALEGKVAQDWIKSMVLILVPAGIIVFSFLTYQRIHIWKDSLTLWNDAISKDQTSPKAFLNRGKVYEDQQQYDLAIADFNSAIQLKKDYPDAYYNRGVAYYFQKKYEQAVADYTLAIHYNPLLAVAWFNRAGTFFTTGKYKEALDDALKAESLGYEVDPKFIEAIKLSGKIK